MKYLLLILIIWGIVIISQNVSCYWELSKTDAIISINDWHWTDSVKYKEGDIVNYNGIKYERTFIASGRIIKAPGDNPFWNLID